MSRPRETLAPPSLQKLLRLRKKVSIRMEKIKKRADTLLADLVTDSKVLNNNIGHTFKVERTAKRMKSSRFADRLGVSRSYLSNLESGRNSWTDELVLKALVALNNPYTSP